MKNQNLIEFKICRYGKSVYYYMNLKDIKVI